MIKETPNKTIRSQLAGRLDSKTFDLLVIGGGITGASIFRDAVLRGLKTALLDAGDYASGTSSKSSKLFHGGLRYITSGDFRLTKEACGERNLAVNLNHRLVKPIPFMIPVYGKRRRRLAFGALLHAYDFLSGYGNYDNHRFLPPEETLRMAPGLSRSGLLGSYIYYDALVSDFRYTLETIKDGIYNGGCACNYTKVTGFVKSEGKICGVSILDTVGGTARHVRARSVVNATGAFTDVIRRLDDGDCTPAIKLSRGTHLVFDRGDIPFHMTVTFFSPIDGRVLFLISHEDCFLYGTTDTWYSGDPAASVPEECDVDYLLASINLGFPGIGLSKEKVRYAYSGFRPLVMRKNTGTSPSGTSREDHYEVSASGLITVTGGKLSTARLMADKTLAIVYKGLEKKAPPCRTHMSPIGGDIPDYPENVVKWVNGHPYHARDIRSMCRDYGASFVDFFEAYLGGISGSTCHDPEIVRLRYICRNEMAVNLEDIIERRIGAIDWDAGEREGYLQKYRVVLSRELSLSNDEFFDQYEAYRHYLASHHYPGSYSDKPVSSSTRYRMLHRRELIHRSANAYSA
ncbi:MAG: glycerol-3-phosphate dehydrogenase/oxidase [Spirochaetales bacterium]|nr:glycerol-3-phosphate dehydrogenase/oxidase [Spirochaetales bacterium]